jgi:hypothetical protein
VDSDGTDSLIERSRRIADKAMEENARAMRESKLAVEYSGTAVFAMQDAVLAARERLNEAYAALRG